MCPSCFFCLWENKDLHLPAKSRANSSHLCFCTDVRTCDLSCQGLVIPTSCGRNSCMFCWPQTAFYCLLCLLQGWVAPHFRSASDHSSCKQLRVASRVFFILQIVRKGLCGWKKDGLLPRAGSHHHLPFRNIHLIENFPPFNHSFSIWMCFIVFLRLLSEISPLPQDCRSCAEPPPALLSVIPW